MTLKPWREIAVPHPDVLEGTFQQSEFAADLTAVHTGQATREYQDPRAFFERTFITEGMRRLLIAVMKRLCGQGGDPVIQLQTPFGGGKTHNEVAVYHLAGRTVPLRDLPGIPPLLDEAGVFDLPAARRVVIDGTALAPGQPWQHGSQTIHTLWGELAWQLGGAEGYAQVRAADANGTSPGKETLIALLSTYAPCVLLMDELVAYSRQFPDGQALSGGSYDSNLSFLQALTEAIKLVPNAVLLASLPESEVEAGSHRGVAALRALEKTFGRVQALWKPVATEEAFEIVRRRLFEPVRDLAARDAVCKAFADAYLAEGAILPSQTQEARYRERLLHAYPIHPEVFDRLYEDWTTLEGFQRTRGVLKLMAKVIYRLWQDQNLDAMILPGSLPLYDGETRNELTYYLPAGWEAVIEKDIDGERAETSALETREPRFGAVNAARRVARTLFLGSAPASASVRKTGIRGLDRGDILLGSLQPGQSAALYSDALQRLNDRLHYLNASGDHTQDTTHYWFDTRANLRREMEDRKGRFSDAQEVRNQLRKVLDKLTSGVTGVEGVHLFIPHGDIPDDSALRLVVLPPDQFYSKQDPRLATDEVLRYLRSHGDKPRYRSNRLLFLAPDHAALGRLRDSLRTVLAWTSIVEDVKDGRLNIDRLQEQQAQKELRTAEEVLPRIARDAYRWLLCPYQTTPTERQPTVEAFPLTASGSALGAEIERVCQENELIITAWSPIHLRQQLREWYWKADRPAVKALAFWEDTQRYLYLPRLKNRAVLEQAIVKGAASPDFFGTAYGQNGDAFEGFQLGDPNLQIDDTLLLIEPGAAQNYARRQTAVVNDAAAPTPVVNAPETPTAKPAAPSRPGAPSGIGSTPSGTNAQDRAFYGSIEINPNSAKVPLVQLAEEIISVLASDPNALIKVTVEINGEFPNGVSESIKRAVSENAASLGFKHKAWE